MQLPDVDRKFRWIRLTWPPRYGQTRNLASISQYRLGTKCRNKKKARRKPGFLISPCCLRCSFRAELIEGARKFLCNGLSRVALDDETLHQIHELAVAQNSNRGRSRRIAFKVRAGALGRFTILTSENGDRLIGKSGVLQCK